MPLDNNKSDLYAKMIREYFLDNRVAKIKNNPKGLCAICAAVLCNLTPDQLLYEIEESDCGSNSLITTFLSNRKRKINTSSVKWISYFGRVMKVVFYESRLANYQLLINKLEKTKCETLRSAFENNNKAFHDPKNKYLENFPPRLLYFIEMYMQSRFGKGWNGKWNSEVYSLFNKSQYHEKFSRFEKLPVNFGAAKNLEICIDQTFGVEIEITTTRTRKIVDFDEPVWLIVANQLIEALNMALEGSKDVHQVPLRYHQPMINASGDKIEPYSLWKVESDASVGWEIVSPKLTGIKGAESLKKVLEKINEVISEHDFICIDHRCGLHLNLETPISNNEEWKSFLSRYIRIEPGVLPLLAPARIFEFNKLNFQYNKSNGNVYCEPISTSEDAVKLKVELNVEDQHVGDQKYDSFNIRKIEGGQNNEHRLEIRIHNGTTSYISVLSWLALWMRVLNHFDFYDERQMKFQCHNFLKSTTPEKEDIFYILEMENIKINSALRKILFNRRILMSSLWEMAIPKKVATWRDAGFYEAEIY